MGIVKADPAKLPELIEICVTEADIIQGQHNVAEQRTRSEFCAIALATKKEFPDYIVGVGFYCITLSTHDKGRVTSYRAISKEQEVKMQRWVMAHDDLQTVKPGCFTLRRVDFATF